MQLGNECFCGKLLTSMCVCVFFPFILDVKFVGCTSWGHTGFLVHLPPAHKYTFVFCKKVHGYWLTVLYSRLRWTEVCTTMFLFVKVFLVSLCVCVCVFFPFILDIKFVGRTSRGHTGGRSHRISPPPSFCGACLNFSREKDSAIPFPRRLWSQILCTNDLIVLHPLGIFILFFSFLVRKIPFDIPLEDTSSRH